MDPALNFHAQTTVAKNVAIIGTTWLSISI